MAAHWQYLRIHYPRCVARRGCLSKLLTLQTCIHLAAVTVAIAIKKKKSRLAFVSIVSFFVNKVSLFHFLKSLEDIWMPAVVLPHPEEALLAARRVWGGL